MYLKFSSWVTAKKKEERNNNHLSKLKNLYMVRKIAFVQTRASSLPGFLFTTTAFASSQSFQSLTS